MSMDEISGLLLMKGLITCVLSARRSPSFTVSTLLWAEKLGRWVLRTKAIPGACRLAYG